MKIAICIGHSRAGDSGAASYGDGVSEWEYNTPIGAAAAGILTRAGHDARVWCKYEGRGYTSAMRWLARQLRDWGADLATELHFNAAGRTAKGFEYLYWGSSSKSKRLAEALLDAQAEKFPAATNRGAKPRGPGQRGASFLRLTHCPAVICEPFFGSNPAEWENYKHAKAGLAEAYAEGVTNYLK